MYMKKAKLKNDFKDMIVEIQTAEIVVLSLFKTLIHLIYSTFTVLLQYFYSTFHFWILLLLFIASPQGTVLKIQVQSCWKSLADRLLQEFAMFSFVDIIYSTVYKSGILLYTIVSGNILVCLRQSRKGPLD